MKHLLWKWHFQKRFQKAEEEDLESGRSLVGEEKGKMCIFCNVNTEQIVLLQFNLHHPVVQTQVSEFSHTNATL